jgi:hypothetical protein
MLRAPRPARGELWIDVHGQGASATLMLRTREHLLLLGTGATYGSGGRRVARYLLPDLRAAGYSRLDLWLPGALTRDVQAALRLVVAQLPVQLALVPPSVAAPPEMQTCRAQHWRWDGIAFGLRGSDDARHCVLTADAGGHRIEVTGSDPGTLAMPITDAAHLVLDDSGLALRPALIGL